MQTDFSKSIRKESGMQTVMDEERAEEGAGEQNGKHRILDGRNYV